VARKAALEDRLGDLDRQQAQIIEALKVGGSIPALVSELKSIQGRRKDMEADLGALDTRSSSAQFQRYGMEIRARMHDWMTSSARNPDGPVRCSASCSWIACGSPLGTTDSWNTRRRAPWGNC